MKILSHFVVQVHLLEIDEARWREQIEQHGPLGFSNDVVAGRIIREAVEIYGVEQLVRYANEFPGLLKALNGKGETWPEN